MKNEIKNKEPRERQGYVPASVKVIEVTAQKIICQSGGEFDGGISDLDRTTGVWD